MVIPHKTHRSEGNFASFLITVPCQDELDFCLNDKQLHKKNDYFLEFDLTADQKKLIVRTVINTLC